VASGGRDQTVRVWNAGTGEERAVLRGHTKPVSEVSFSPDGQRLASAGKDGSVRIWSLAGGAPLVLRGHEGGARAIAFSPDGQRVAGAGADGTVRIWRADGTGTPTVIQDQPPGRPVGAVVFSPDSRSLAVSGQDGAVRIWPSDSNGQGRPTLNLDGHRDVGLSPGGRFATAHGDSTDPIWHCDVCGPITEVRAMADTRLTRALTAEERDAFVLPIQ
jgi:WD40 repeat protein